MNWFGEKKCVKRKERNRIWNETEFANIGKKKKETEMYSKSWIHNLLTFAAEKERD